MSTLRCAVMVFRFLTPDMVNWSLAQTILNNEDQ
jgi:hypothetical protein